MLAARTHGGGYLLTTGEASRLGRAARSLSLSCSRHIAHGIYLYTCGFSVAVASRCVRPVRCVPPDDCSGRYTRCGAIGCDCVGHAVCMHAVMLPLQIALGGLPFAHITGIWLAGWLRLAARSCPKLPGRLVGWTGRPASRLTANHFTDFSSTYRSSGRRCESRVVARTVPGGPARIDITIHRHSMRSVIGNFLIHN